jgi:hypothetical protein
MAASHLISANTLRLKPPQQLKQYSLNGWTVLFFGGVEGLCVFSLGLVVPLWADLHHFQQLRSSPMRLTQMGQFLRTFETLVRLLRLRIT